jgi:hypothetical protein
MGISFSLIEKAVDLATRVFVTVRDKNDSNAEQAQSGLITIIEDVSKKIDALASDIAGQVAYQLEKQQLEKLSAQAKVVKLALDFGNDSMLGPAVASISEQIEFSRLRLAEGKQEWFGPWMIAESVRIEALRIMAASPRAMAVVERETLNFRINILNHAGKLLIGSSENPWVRIADFVDGRNEDILLDLREVGAFQTFATAPVDDDKEALAAVSSLVKAASWPFPTSSRP